MHKKNIYAIGLMSGTSLDGLDVVYVRFDSDDYQNYKLLNSWTYPYSEEWISRLRSGIQLSDTSLLELDVTFGRLLGSKVKTFVEENDISEVDFIASHGHTIFHEPDKGITLQIGNGQELANSTQCKVVCDFRKQDVQLGGQGAPLVPVGDKMLFSQYDACLNLGGFANVSYDKDGERVAFDICPVNIVLNHFSKILGHDFDNAGKLAADGKLDSDLYRELNALEFYQLKGPKSLGYEWVVNVIFPIIEKYKLPARDVLRTFVEHIAFQLSEALFLYDNVLVTGGGTFNKYLMERLSTFYSGTVHIPSNELINYKEALVFAFLGLLRMNDKVNCLKSVTGAEKNHSSGAIFNPNNTQ